MAAAHARRRCSGAAAGVLAVVAFCVLATAGLSILTRYLLLPATILAIFAAAAICGWTLLPREDPWRLRWAALGALITALGMRGVRPVAAATACANTRSALVDPDPHPRRAARRSSPTTALADCAVDASRTAAPSRRSRCGRTIRAARDPQRAGDRPLDRPVVVPTSQAVAEQFVLDARDKDRALPPFPPATGGYDERAAVLAHRRRVRTVGDRP